MNILFKFKLNDELSKEDSMGVGYEYLVTKHPIATDMLVVHFNDDGEWGSTNYEESEVRDKIDKGIWVIV